MDASTRGRSDSTRRRSNHVRRVDVAALIAVLFLASCGATPPSPSPRPTPAGSLAASPSTAPSDTAPGSSATPAGDPFLGSLVVTVSDRLRVRSAPDVSDASIKYEPLLPIGTELRVIGGPMTGSGYVWYDVSPVSFPLSDDVEHGWIAMADHDGQPWIALADQPIDGLEDATSAVARAAADPADARTVSASVTAFGLDLYRQMLASPSLGLREKNVVFSPTSIALAMGMARAGARNETASQMDAVLHTNGWDELGPGLNALAQALASRDGGFQDDEGNAHVLALRIANAAFAQRGWSVEPAYLDAVAAAFGAGIKLVDYAQDPEAARKTINAWVSQKTAGRIPQLLEPPNVTEATRLYLVNAVYLKANWVAEFPVEATAPKPFTGLGGSKVVVPTMSLSGRQEVPYLRGKGWQATELRYRGTNRTTPLAMTLIMPDDLAAFESSMSVTLLRDISSDLTAERTRLNESVEPNQGDDCGFYPYSLDLSMPRFEVSTRAQLKDMLAALGMPVAFDPDRADFSGIHQPESGDAIHIGNVIHQANIDVDEKGTEAAAATAIGADTGGCTGPAPSKSIPLALDHPFIFVLRDIETGAVLFMGRVVDPSLTK
jgi:serpin B